MQNSYLWLQRHFSDARRGEIWSMLDTTSRATLLGTMVSRNGMTMACLGENEVILNDQSHMHRSMVFLTLDSAQVIHALSLKHNTLFKGHYLEDGYNGFALAAIDSDWSTRGTSFKASKMGKECFILVRQRSSLDAAFFAYVVDSEDELDCILQEQRLCTYIQFDKMQHVNCSPLRFLDLIERCKLADILLDNFKHLAPAVKDQLQRDGHHEKMGLIDVRGTVAVEAAATRDADGLEVADPYVERLSTLTVLKERNVPEDMKVQLRTRDTASEMFDNITLEDSEQYRLQMAGISTAASGYWKEGDAIHPDYDTVALRDVAKLYAKYDDIHKKYHALLEAQELPVPQVVELHLDVDATQAVETMQTAFAIGAEMAERLEKANHAVGGAHYKGFIDDMQWIDAISKMPQFRDPSIFIPAVMVLGRKYIDRLGRKDDDYQEILKAVWYLRYIAAYMKNGCVPILGANVDAILAA